MSVPRVPAPQARTREHEPESSRPAQATPQDPVLKIKGTLNYCFYILAAH